MIFIELAEFPAEERAQIRKLVAEYLAPERSRLNVLMRIRVANSPWSTCRQSRADRR